MTPFPSRMPPPGARSCQLLASPVPRPPTMIGAPPPPPPPRPPRPPPPPPPPPAPAPPGAGGCVPFGPQAVVIVEIHLRLRFLTVVVLTFFSALKRLPLRSPE